MKAGSVTQTASNRERERERECICITSKTQLYPHISKGKPLADDEWMKVEKRDGVSEIVKMFPSTPAVAASQQASCSPPNELFTSTAADQTLTSKSWLAASILLNTFTFAAFAKKTEAKTLVMSRSLIFFFFFTTRLLRDCVSVFFNDQD